MKRFFLPAWFVFLPGFLAAQDAETSLYPQYEIVFGLGYVNTYEKSVFNIPGESEKTPDIGMNLAAFYNINERFAAGFHLYGFVQTLSGYTVLDAGGAPRNVTFSLTSFNVGANGRLMLSPGPVSPFLLVTGSYVTGSVSSPETGSLGHSGFTAGVGGGIKFMVSDQWAFSATALYSKGSATWKQKPFQNSSGNSFDPSVFLIVANISYQWANP